MFGSPRSPFSLQEQRPTSFALTSRSEMAITDSQILRKRAVLGERLDNLIDVPPPPKSHMAKTKLANKSMITSTPRNRFSTSASSPKSKTKQRPSFAGSTPHPARMSIGMMLEVDEETTMLFDMRPPDVGDDILTSPIRGEADPPRIWGRARLGEGRLMTPADSQELPVSVTLKPIMC
jgi:hypothetical protein